jgi:chromosome segregation ATPase
VSDETNYHDAGIYADVEQTLKDAAHQMQAADALLIEAEKNQQTLIEHTRLLLHYLAGAEEQIRFWHAYADAAEHSSDQWKQRAEDMERERDGWLASAGEMELARDEMEKQRNVWQNKFEEMEALYRRAAARAADLAAKAGVRGCPDCGSERVEYLEDGPGTTVHCKECGFSEEV